MEATSPSRGRISAGAVIGETFSIYGQNFGVLIGSALLVFVVVGLVSGILSTGSLLLNLIGSVVALAGHALYTGFVVRLVQDVRDGRRDQSVGDLFESARPVILPLIGFGILFGVGVTVGFILLIVPGLVLATFWSVGAPAIVVERVGVIEAFGRSWRLVSGSGWSVFGVLLIVLLIVFGIGIVLAVIANPIGNGEVSTWIASIVSNTLTAPIFAIAVTCLYYDLAGPPAAPGAPAPGPPGAPGPPTAQA